LLIVMTMDAIIGLIQFTLGLLLFIRGTPEFELDLREMCSVSVVDDFSLKKCDEYWKADRTAGMRLAWESMYWKGERDGDKQKSKELGQQQDSGLCCGASFYDVYNMIRLRPAVGLRSDLQRGKVPRALEDGRVP